MKRIGLILSACTTNKGQGGSGSVTSKVMMAQHNNDNYSLQCNTTITAKEDIFTVYGNNTSL